jgi:hypothetical protein
MLSVFGEFGRKRLPFPVQLSLLIALLTAISRTAIRLLTAGNDIRDDFGSGFIDTRCKIVCLSSQSFGFVVQSLTGLRHAARKAGQPIAQHRAPDLAEFRVKQVHQSGSNANAE